MSNYEKFKKDLSLGQKGERVIAEYLQKYHGVMDIQFNDDYKYDIKGFKNGKELTFEVKTDRYEYFKKIKTYNMFIELTCSNKPSGINSTQADYFIYYYPDLEVFYFISTNDLRKLIETSNFDKKFQSGDNGRVEGVCIHRNLFSSNFIICRIKKDKNIWE